MPEGLLPTITLALAVGVREMARRGAWVKRLSTVETLGSTGVICTDKTGTLSENRMRVTAVWTPDLETAIEPTGPAGPQAGTTVAAVRRTDLVALARIAAACNHADLHGSSGKPAGDPTELALLELAVACGLDVSVTAREKHRRQLFRFDPQLKLMTTVDELDGGLVADVKGAPEEVLALCTAIRRGGKERPITAADREEAARAMNGYAGRGLRVLALAHGTLPVAAGVPGRREDAERELCLVGLTAMLDPPRPEVPAAIERAYHAGIRHRRQRADRRRDRSQRGHRRRRASGRQRDRSGRHDQGPAP